MKDMLKEDFQIHDVLNPKLWQDNQLLPEVRQKIVDIVANFEEYVEIPIHIVDIVIVGSNASYNYTQYSDFRCSCYSKSRNGNRDTRRYSDSYLQYEKILFQ